MTIVGIAMISTCIANWYVAIWDNNKRCTYLIWVCAMYMVAVWMFYIGVFLSAVAFFVLNTGNDFLVGLSSTDSHRIASLLPVLSYNLCMQKLKSKRFITFSTIRTLLSVHCPSSLSCIDLFWLCVTDWILESYNDLLIKSGTRFALGLVSIAHISAAFLCVEHSVVEFVALFVSDKMFVWT